MTSKDQLLQLFTKLQFSSTKTVQHAACPTCEVHTEALKAAWTPKADLESFVQAKNLFFKVPSKGGPLKDKMFLVCASVDTEVDNKKLSARMGVKASAPLRLASEELFDQVLQIPRGSVNPFVMMNESAKEVYLLLDAKFQRSTMLFHPMTNEFTTSISSGELDAFLADVGAKGRYQYVDFGADTAISLDDAGSAAGAPAAKPQEKKAAPAKPAAEANGHSGAGKDKKIQAQFAEDHLFTRKPAAETIFSVAFSKYDEGKSRV